MAVLLTAGFGAYAEGGNPVEEPLQAMMGDVNGDGECNVLDVQAGICQVLRIREQTREANIDEEGEVDVLDIQHMINTALRNGGLVQRVRGQLQYDGDMVRDKVRIRAIAANGETVEGKLNLETGEFTLILQVRNAWAIAFSANVGEEGQERVGVVVFPIDGLESNLLPVPDLSEGDPLDLGQLQFGERMRTQQDIRTMLRAINRHRRDAEAVRDDNGNGIPDFVEPLLNRVMDGPGLPPGIDPLRLRAMIAPCIAENIDEIVRPDLADTDENGVPDFIEPLMACVRNNIRAWIEETGVQIPDVDENGNGVPDAVDAIMLHVRAGVAAWIRNLNFQNLVDADGDGIPDRMQQFMGRPGGPNFVDADGDGVPDFAQDGDGDGVPNWRDPDARTQGDCDGDGILNNEDDDKDNDGVLDYADAEPCNPEVS
jgi:hypothetical protein